MFETIYVGTSGLLTHAKGLRVVGNNLANVNTPGFKSSQLQFEALFAQGQGGAYAPSQGKLGNGVQPGSAKLSFRAGVDQNTGNPLDLTIDGNGLFTVKRDEKLLYTRSGDFRFNAENILTNAAGDKVQARDASGALADVKLDELWRSDPKATATVKMAGNLTSTVAVPPVDVTVNGVTVIDGQGASHLVNLKFKDNGGGNYTVTITDAGTAATVLGTGTLKFVAGFPDPAANSVTFNYAMAGVTSFAVKLDFSQNVTSTASASTLNMVSQDGYGPGVMTEPSIDADGTVTVHYSNNQSAKGPRLALAQFQTEDDLSEIAGGMFALREGAAVRYGYAGGDEFGALVAGHREGSNVDLAEEFGNLILMQRGYQASSHVISTANEMIQQLFDMKGR